MSRKISRAESWERAYEAFNQINFTAFDYNTVKASLVEYMKIYHPESFNDYVESDEFIAIAELFSYVAELLAYRIDMTAHENFITAAQRKQSILRLATMLSYDPSRNIPARALVKIDSVKTTENVYDSRGTNLSGRKILWNDPNNTDWKEQFFLVINRILQQPYGTVAPSDRVQVDDVLFELYSLDNKPTTNGVYEYSANANGSSYPMELVPVALNSRGPYERRPGLGSSFSILYGSDGLGDSSDSTGFFFFTKQGKLTKVTQQFDGVTPNQKFLVDKSNINETDVWVNQIDPTTGEVIQTTNIDPLQRNLGKQGEWTQLTKQGVENVIFNNESNRNKYQIETLEGDKIRIIFGDGEFADVPNGLFDIWTRQSANKPLVFARNSIIQKTATFNYQDSLNTQQTVVLSFTAVNTITNASASEDIERVRSSAPLVYYTQDRMVNGPDYNIYPLQDPSIVKLRAVNRTFAGHSKYIAWHDPSEYYESVKMFGDDLIVYYRTVNIQTPVPNSINPEIVVSNHIQPLLTDPGVMTFHVVNGLEIPVRLFTQEEVTRIVSEFALALTNNVQPLHLVYEFYPPTNTTSWVTYTDGSVPVDAIVTFTMQLINNTQWIVRYNTTLTIVESPTTKFWHHNDLIRTVSTDTYNADLDNIVLLQANVNANRNGLLSTSVENVVTGGTTHTTSPNIGQPNINQLYVVPPDVNNDGVPDDILLEQLLDRRQNYGSPILSTVYTLDFYYLIDIDELEIRAYDEDGVLLKKLEKYVDYYEHTSTSIDMIDNNTEYAGEYTGEYAEEYAGVQTTKVNIFNDLPVGAGSPAKPTVMLEFRRVDYVYFVRVQTATGSIFQYSGSSDSDAYAWRVDSNRDDIESGDNVRYRGRDNINFAWFHHTPRGHLIDPSTTNINDLFVITKGYYTATQDWLRGVADKPTTPTPLSLRTDYGYLIEAKMISDTVLMHAGRFKILFGKHAPVELQAKIKVVKSPTSAKTDNEIKVAIVQIVNVFFDINSWEFGETFNFTELGSQIHGNLVKDVSSVVLVPTRTENQFGDLFQVIPQEDEIFIPSISVDDIEIVEFLNPQNMRQYQGG